MWLAEVMAVEPASPLHLTVSLARNGLQATHTHMHTHTYTLTHNHRKRERGKKGGGGEGKEREVRRLFVVSLLTGCLFGREPPKVAFRESVCVYVCV